MTSKELYQEIEKKRSFLCVGLDSDIERIPSHLKECDDPQFEFNKAIVDATAEFAICYKPNLAFYEARGTKGWISFERTCRYIRREYPNIFIIADAKRGDIGNTSELYARGFFRRNMVDAVTLAPYMGRDTVEPFLSYEGKWAVILALTSNKSAEDFELQELTNGNYLFEEVLKKASSWGTTENTMFVVGATQANLLARVRKIVPNHFLLVPGVGAQGGSLEEVAKHGMNKQCGLIVNSSRGIIFANDGDSFAEAAAEKSYALKTEMEQLLNRYL